MRANRHGESAFSQPRLIFAFALFSLGVLLGASSLLPSIVMQRGGPRLASLRITPATPAAPAPWKYVSFPAPISKPSAPDVAGIPTFGNPVISGIGGFGYEQDIRIDPTLNVNGGHTIYTSVPGSAAADTSWIWRSLDDGKTFKWVPGAAPLQGKVTTCHGGGDTELGVDSAGHLYFNDLTLANFSVARSTDSGVTFTCSNNGVPDTAVDRQWYAIDGDPMNGGNLYLANDEIGPGGVNCGNGIAGAAANNVLVMYRSPVNGLGATGGLAFSPANKITAVGTCDEGIMGNNEISPVATKTGQPNGLGGYATLATAVKHVYVIHDNAPLNQVRIGRCFPVATGAPVANVSDPSGLNCTDLLVSDLNAGGGIYRTGGNFPTMAIDKAGNLYAVWEQAPADANGTVTGDTVLKYSYSTNEGNSWSTPITIDTSGSPDGFLHNNVFAWIAAGDDGRINIAWYGTTALSNPDDATCGQNALVPPAPPSRNLNGPDATSGFWSLWLVQSLNAHSASPTFTAPIRASSHHNHRGTIQTLLGGQCGDRQGLGDFLQLRTGPQGEAQISYADTNHLDNTVVSHAMFVRQNGGNGLFAASSPINIAGLNPINTVSDPSGDAKYEAGGIVSASMPQLDILNSTITAVASAPCSITEPCLKVTMTVNNLSLAPTIAQDPDPDLVWSTQWFVPSTSDAKGGANFHVYAESTNGGALQCYFGQNAVLTDGGFASITYPGGMTALPAANCQSTLGPNGTISIYVPLSDVSEPDPIDQRLHEVTSSTMTLQVPANTNPDLSGTGVDAGSLFNLIDVAQGYIFEPPAMQITNITRLANGHVQLDCLGAPNQSYTILAAPTINATFTPLVSVTADGNGIFQYEDPDAAALTRRFYKLRFP